MANQLLEALQRTRPSYDTERAWQRFLTDSYTGGGGYQGSIRQPEAGWWGAGAERYARAMVVGRGVDGALPENYLDRYPREDEPKFRSRLAVSHLWNFVGPLTDLKISYLLRKPITYQDQPDELSAWREDVDGAGTSWDELRPLVVLMAAIWGWTPLLVDMMPAAPGESVAQARERGAGQPRAIPLTPANLVDYAHDGKRFQWAKIRTSHTEVSAWNAKRVEVDEYRIWTPESVETYRVVKEEGDGEGRVEHLGVMPHPFGQVPLVIFRHQAAPGDPVCGLPMHAGPARAQKRLYNLLSELDEHMRSQVFAVLVLAKTKNDVGGEVTIGTDNALDLDGDARQQHYYMSPDPGIAAVYEARIEATIREGIYRASRTEYSRPTGAATSGVARAYEFSATNRAIADFGGELARGEEWMDSLVWAGLGKSPDALDGYSAQAAQDYGVEDLAQEIENTITALGADLGPTMTGRLKFRLAERLDPQMPPDVRAAIEDEIREDAEQAAADAAMAREMRASMDPADPNEEPPPDPGTEQGQRQAA